MKCDRGHPGTTSPLATITSAICSAISSASAGEKRLLHLVHCFSLLSLSSSFSFFHKPHTHTFSQNIIQIKETLPTQTHTHITLIRSIFVLPLLLVNNMIYLAFALFKKVKEIRELVVSILRLWCWAVLFLYQKWKGKANWSSTADGSHQLVFGLPPSSPPSRKQAPWSWHIRITNPAINTNVQCKWS